MELNKENLALMLKEIDWKISDSPNGLNHWIKNHKKENTGFRVTTDSIEIRDKGFNLIFSFKDSKIEKLDKYCICISAKNNESVFINMYNHDIR